MDRFGDLGCCGRIRLTEEASPSGRVRSNVHLLPRIEDGYKVSYPFDHVF